MKVTRHYTKLSRVVYRLDEGDLHEAVIDYLKKHQLLTDKVESAFRFEWIDLDSDYASGVELEVTQEFEEPSEQGKE